MRDLEAVNRELTVLCVNLSSEFWLASVIRLAHLV